MTPRSRIEGQLRLSVPGATNEQLARGLSLARAVFEQSKVSPLDVANAEFAIEGWDVAHDGRSSHRPPKPVWDAIRALASAEQAAVAECCREWAQPPEPGAGRLEVFLSATESVHQA